MNLITPPRYIVLSRLLIMSCCVAMIVAVIVSMVHMAGALYQFFNLSSPDELWYLAWL